MIPSSFAQACRRLLDRPHGRRLVLAGSRGREGHRRVQPRLEVLEDRTLLDGGPIAHPTYMLYHPGFGPLQSSTPPASAFTPAQIRKAYGIDSISASGITGDGTSQTVAIVDAYDWPTAAIDLHNFDVQFGLPDPPSFKRVNQFGNASPLPGTDPSGPGNGWEVEESLDVEWVHAIAPKANIVLVEANTAADTDLVVDAVASAANLPGVSAVSMSFGTDEFIGETAEDPIFTTPSGHNGVTFLASSGDLGEPGGYPAFSPNVVAVGGTSLFLNLDNSYQSESGWEGSGGGISTQESEPAYQNGVQNTSLRTNPDVSFVADPFTGVAIYDSYDFGPGTPWVQIGGTSLSCPCWAGLIAITNQLRVGTGGTTLDGLGQTLPRMYGLPATDFHDITTGNNGFAAGPGYDLVTGIGTPRANLLVPDLAASTKLPPTVTPPANQTAVEGASQSFSLGSFTDSSSGPWTVTVAWGDGTPNTMFRPPTTGSLGSQSHTFIEEGTYTVTVTVADTGDGQSAMATFQVAVSDPAVKASFLGFDTVAEGMALGNVAVATFTDPGGAEPTTSYSATIVWGDGTAATAGTITSSGGTFTVRGSHTYAEEGTYPVTTLINHEGIITLVGIAIQLLTNGSFETADFTGWTTSSNLGPRGQFFSRPVVVGAGVSGGFGFFATAPTDGNFCAFEGFDGDGPGTVSIAQDIVIPDWATLFSFDYRAAWDMLRFGGSTRARTFMVDIEPFGGGAPLQSILVLTAPPGTMNLDTGNLHFSMDLSAFAGQSVRIALDIFLPESYTGPGQLEIDNVNLLQSEFASGLPVSDPPVVGTAVNVSATAGKPFSGALATFSDPGGPEANDGTHYSASIDWGDKSPVTTGTMTLSGSTFTVNGSHTYAASGSYTITCTINHETIVTTVKSTATVAGAAPPVVTPPSNQNTSEGASNSFTLGSFTDASNGPWTVTVAWGDGTQTMLTPPTMTGSLGSQAHTYSEESASYTVTVTVTDTGDGQSGSATFLVAVSDPAVVPGPGVSIAVVEGKGFSNQAVGTFTDPGGAELPANYTATINWGDGSSTTGTIAFSGSPDSKTDAFTVTGSHTYGEEGSYQISVTFTHETAPTATVGGSATVSDPAVLGTAVAVSVVMGTPFSGPVATFSDPGGAEPNASDPNPNSISGHYTASIDWGDKTTATTGIITLSGSTFTVSASHTYAASGSYTITCTITHETVVTTVPSTATVAAAPPVVTPPSNQNATEGASNSFTLGSFTDANNGPWTVTVAWGDGTQTTLTPPTMTGSLGSQAHTYSEEAASYTVTVTVTDTGDGQSGSATFQVGVSDPAVVPGPGVSIAAVEAKGFSNQAVGTFTDPGGAELPANYTASVNWGDGSTTTGTITFSGSPGSKTDAFTVSGSHTYGEEGTYQTSVTITHETAPTGTVTGSATVSDPAVLGTSVAVSAVLGTPFSGAVAAFSDPGGAEPNASDPNPNSISGHYTASIDWGDKTTATTGTITLSGSTFTVSGNHTYAAPGSYIITCTINHETIVTTVMSPATVVAVPPPPVVTPPSNQTASEGAANSFSLGTFTDQGSGPWTVTVAWGDGTPNTTFSPTTTGSLGSQAHTYSEEATSYTVTVTVTHTGDGQSGSATFQVAVSDPAVLGMPVTVSATAGTPFSGAVATFTDPGGAEQAGGISSHYTAAINWGDGAPLSTGSISFNSGTGVFTVNGNHTYAAAGPYTIICTINHETVLTPVLSPAAVGNLGLSVQPQLTKGIAFWQNMQLGQQLISSFGLTSTGLTLGQWLATTFPNLYGGANGAPNLSTFSDAQVAAFYLSLFFRFGQQLDAEVMATALNVFASTASLGGTTAQAYGFTVNATGLGAYSWNVGLSGPAFGVPNNAILNVYQLLLAANNTASGGEPWGTEPLLSNLGLGVFRGVNGDGGPPAP